MKPIVKLHTIQQWNNLDPGIRPIVLKNIRLRDRLLRWLMQRSTAPKLTEPKFVRCKACHPQYPGWFLEEPRYPGIHPSQLSGDCLLKIYLEMIGEKIEERLDPKSRFIFDFGHAIHHMFQRYGEKGAWGPQYEKEVTISGELQDLAKELMLEGSADADNILVIDDIPQAPIYEVGIIHEYKTMNSKNFDRLSSPKAHHRLQATIYSAVLDRPIVVFLYMNKDNQSLQDFPVPFDEAVWKIAEEKARNLKRFYDEKKAPPGTVGYHCQDCGNNLTCPAYKEEVEKRFKKGK